MQLKDLVGMGCGVIIIICAISGVINGFAMGYVINTWLEYAGKPGELSYWWGFGIGAIPYVGQVICFLAILASIITPLIMMFT